MIKKIIKCGAGWCAPCKALEPIFLEVENEHNDTIDFKEINVDNARGEDFDFIEHNNVRSIPTVFFLDENDNILHKEVGYMTKDKFNELIDKLNVQNVDKK